MKKQRISIQAKLLFLMLGIIVLTTSIFIYVFIKEEKGFFLNLGIAPADIEIFAAKINQKLALILSIIILFSLLILSLFIKKILSPILKLSQETRYIASGDLDYPVSVETEDEIGEIAKDFKVLEKSLKATIRDLRKRNKEIEALLKASTTMASKLDSEEILKLIIEYIVSLLGYDYVFVSRLSEDKKEVLNHILSGGEEIKHAIEDIIEVPISSIKAPVEELPFFANGSFKEGIIIRKNLKEILGKIIPESACDAIQVLIGAKNFIDIPLLVKEHIAYFLLISTSKEDITKQDEDALSIFIHYAGLALENAKFYEEKERFTLELEKIVLQRTREIEDMHKKLAHQEKMVALGTMSSRMGHELKNPLAIIRSNVYFLKKKAPQEFIKYLEMIGRAEEKANIVIEETMGFVKGVLIKRDLVNINHIIEEALKSLSHELLKIDVVKELSPDIPTIPLDSHWIHNLFTNIIINAVQAIEGEGVFHLEKEKIGRIKIKSGVCDNSIEVSIADSGPGVAENIRGKIFEPFFGTKIRGTGLGLAISKEIVDKHNGTISVSESEDKGALFTVKIPIER
ncbi:MAG: ATP-binding protein [bacterium]